MWAAAPLCLKELVKGDQHLIEMLFGPGLISFSRSLQRLSRFFTCGKSQRIPRTHWRDYTYISSGWISNHGWPLIGCQRVSVALVFVACPAPLAPVGWVPEPISPQIFSGRSHLEWSNWRPSEKSTFWTWVVLKSGSAADVRISAVLHPQVSLLWL